MLNGEGFVDYTVSLIFNAILICKIQLFSYPKRLTKYQETLIFGQGRMRNTT